MTKLILILVLLLAGLIVYSSQTYASLPNLSKLIYSSICNTPLYYRIDTVDPRFNLSEDEFKQAITKAEDIWEVASGRNLFNYKPQGELSINLIFDERQSLSNEIIQLEKQLQSGKSNLDTEITKYEQQAADFNKRLETLNTQIRFWNNIGGAPHDTYDRLTKEQEMLKQEAKNLNAKAQELNLSTQNYNLDVNELNQTIGTFNTQLHERPEEGIYIGEENRIEIYFYINENEFFRTLAHELGHARGLQHIPNPKALMYQNTTQAVVATEEDLEALENICQKKVLFNGLRNKLPLIKEIAI